MGGVGHAVLEIVQLVGDGGHLAGACHGLLEDAATAHVARVLAEVADGDAAIDGDLPIVGLLLLDDQTEDRGLAGAVGTDEPDLLAAKDAHLRVDEEDLFAVALAYVVEPNHRSRLH